MKISVITPVYNAETYLDKCIQSVLNQSFPDFELILINDGSTDSSGTICDSYAAKDKRVKVFHQENGGPSAARNKGIDEIQGDYVTFIDADDYVEPFYLKAFIPLDEDLDINNSIVIQGYQMEDGSGKVKVYNFQRKFYPESLYSELFYSTNLIQRLPFVCMKLFPAHIIKQKKIYFDKEIHFGEDFIFFLECLKYAENVLVIEQAGYHYQYNDNSLTQSLYSYESEIKRLNTVRDQLADLANKFSFDEKTISLHKTYLKFYFYRAAYSLYLHHPLKKRGERVALLRENGRNDNYELITKYNKPKTRFTKGFKFLFTNKLFYFLDLYILLWFKYRNTGLEYLSNRT